MSIVPTALIMRLDFDAAALSINKNPRACALGL